MRVAFVLALFLGLCAPLSSQREQNPCWAKATTQLAMNVCAATEFAETEAELNRVYRKLLKRGEGDPVFTSKLQTAERAWLAYRDAHLKSLYPTENPGGSVLPMCVALARTRLTKERIAELKAMLEEPEGDVCRRQWEGKPGAR